MELTREVQRLTLSFLAMFIFIGAAAGYWAIFGADSILLREDNPRAVEDEAAIRRGSIYPSNQATPLAQTIVAEDGTLNRRYMDPASYSYTGYFSLRYGVGGAEAAYDAILRGEAGEETLATYFERDVLHLPQVGADVRLTLDSRIQRRLYEALDGLSGAAVVLRVPDGAVLSLLSVPTYNPNTLDEDWEILIEAAGNPFFNRAVQGQYQPGGLIQTGLLGAALLEGATLTIPDDNATEPVTINGLTLTCAQQPPVASLTLEQAYAYSCPTPFLTLAQSLPESSIEQSFDRLRAISVPLLEGFVPDDLPPEATPEVTEAAERVSFEERVLGQGELTVSPLGIASATGAFINGGNAPLPYALEAVRPPSEDWITRVPTPQSLPLLTEANARRLREQMQNNLLILGVDVPQGTVIGGHAALSFSGEETQSWFTGFITMEGGRGLTIALVLEDTADAARAAEIGIDTLLYAAALPSN